MPVDGDPASGIYPSDMPPELPHLPTLELFLAVVDEGGLAAGARRLGVHQPNASRMIARLEREAGTPLLERHPRGSRPTSAGLLLAAHAREVVEAAEGFATWLAHERQDAARELALGASMTIAEHLLPAWLAELRRLDPDLRVTPTVANSTQVLAALREGAVSLGFIEGPQVPGWAHAMTIAEDELVLVVAPSHPWAARTEVPAAELAATALVVREGGSGTREALEQVMPGAAATAPVQELASNAAVRVAVAAGAGPAVLSRLAVQGQLATGELVAMPVAGASLRRRFSVVWTGPRRLGGPAAALLEIARGAGR